jgi:hypothetical protein
MAVLLKLSQLAGRRDAVIAVQNNMTDIILTIRFFFFFIYLRAYSTAQRPIINNARTKERDKITWIQTEEEQGNLCL